MNIWIVHQNAYTPTGSGSTRHHEMARQLMARGHKVTILASSFDHKRWEETVEFGNSYFKFQKINDVSYLWVKSIQYKQSKILRLLGMFDFYLTCLTCQKIMKNEIQVPNIIVGSSPPLLGAYAGLSLAKKLNVPFVLEIRDIWPMTLLDFGALSKHNPLYFYFSKLEKDLYRSARRIISTLPEAERHISRIANKTPPVTWIPNGTAMLSSQWRPAPVANGKFKVLYTGAHGPSNDLETILESAWVLQNSFSARAHDIEFHFYGEGSEKARLVAHAKKRGLTNVQFFPAFQKESFEDIMPNAHAFVASVKNKSLYQYGISLNKLSDYCAIGRPIALAASVGGADFVKQSGCGFTVPAEDGRALGNALLTLAEMSDEKRNAMGRAGRVFAERNLDFSVLAERLETVLFEAAGITKG